MDHGCCICRDPSRTISYKIVEGHALLKCQNCKLIFTKNLPQTQETFFEESQSENSSVEYWSTPQLFDQFYHVFKSFFNERLARIEKHGVTGGKVLDIGTGYGLWANYLKTKGYQVEGIEITPDIASYARNKYQIDIENTSIENYHTEQKFDLICMFDVLEHLERPDLILKKIKSWLKPHGLLYIQVPNVLGLRYPYGHNLGLPYHIWQFNPKSLKNLLIKEGYQPKRFWTGTQGVIGAHKANKANLLKRAAWKTANLIKIGNRVQIISTL